MNEISMPDFVSIGNRLDAVTKECTMAMWELNTALLQPMLEMKTAHGDNFIKGKTRRKLKLFRNQARKRIIAK